MYRYTCATLFVLGLLVAILSLNPGAKANRKTFQKGTEKELNIAKSMSYEYLAKYVSAYGIDSAKDLKVTNVSVDELSMAHTKMQQSFNGVPVFGGETIVHLNSDGSLFNITDSLVSKINVDTTPNLSLTEASSAATNLYGCSDCLTAEPKVDMFVLRHKNKDHLVYRVQLERLDGSAETKMPIYFIDAHTGKKVWEYNNLQTSGLAVGYGISNYYGYNYPGYPGTVVLRTYQYDLQYIVDSTLYKETTYYLEDIEYKLGTFDSRGGGTAYRSSNSTNYWNANNQKSLVDVHYGVNSAYRYYIFAHGRTGIDGNSGPGHAISIDGVTRLTTAIARYGPNYNNAMWTGQYMLYGDGDGTTHKPLTSLDICGHEMTHGVIQYTAGLIYAGESGAINESMADVFGAMVERGFIGESAKTWKIGEDWFTPNIANDASRYIDNPHLASSKGFTADDDPDHYSERYTGGADNGGVHINSGIANKAFYLVAKGGSHHLGGSMTGIGAAEAANIWYKALTTYMTSSTNFSGTRQATLLAAGSMHGFSSTQYNAVATAWTLCGVN